jgi:hypothetical protein
MDTFVKKKIKLTDQKKKKSKISPLSEKYKQYLKQPSPSKKKKNTPSPRRSDIQVVKKNPSSPRRSDIQVVKKNPPSKVQSVKETSIIKKESVPPIKQTAVKKSVTNKSRKVTDRVRKTKSKRKLSRKHTREKRISIKCFPKNKKNIKDRMKGIEKMSKETMKQELRDNGIQIKGTQDSLVKDIYTVYSLGGIRITRE